MNRTLLATKTYLPGPQASRVTRSRLLDRLDESLESGCRLVLVSAPAGSGKSTLLAEWAAGQPGQPAWLSLDGEDNELVRFWMYVIAAVQARAPGAAQGCLDDLRAGQPPAMSDFLPALINALAELPGQVVLVLDDYYHVDLPAIHESMGYFVDHLPPNLKLVIATRSDPGLPLHRWRARGQLVELRSADMRFTLEEAQAFLNEHMGLRLGLEEIRLLGERTEGWAVGLQMAAISLRGRSDSAGFITRFSGSHHYVLEYLTNEVLTLQPPELQTFLLQTAILEQLCGPLCQAVTGREDSAELLESLLDQNLFVVSLDDERYWFRYHHLFCDLLRMKIARQGEDILKALHGRAANWYAENGLVDESLAHALAAGDLRFAADLVNRSWRQAVHEGRPKASLKWLESLPGELIAGDALLSAAFAWTLWLMGRTAEVEPYIDSARQAYARLAEAGQAPASDYEYSSLPGQMAALKAMTVVRRGDWTGARNFAEEAIALSPPQEALARGLAFSALGLAQRESGDFERAADGYEQSIAPNLAARNIMALAAVVASLGRVYLIQGRLHAADELYRQTLETARSLGMAEMPAYGLVRVGQAELAYERNELEQARALLERGSDQGRRSGYLDLIKNIAVLQARLKRAEGDLAGGLAVLEEAEAVMLRSKSALLTQEVQAYMARFRAELGETQKAAAWLETIALDVEANPGYTRGMQYWNAVFVLAAMQEWERALEWLEALEGAAREAGNRGRELEYLCLHATMLEQTGQKEQGLACLRRALELAGAEGYARTFLDCGPGMIDLLRQTARLPQGESSSLAAGAVLKAGGIEVEAPAKAESGAGQTPTGPLSERELEVLRELAAGRSNPEIAERLIVSLATVKTHVSHIYDKLDAQNRAEAVARAKGLGLI